MRTYPRSSARPLSLGLGEIVGPSAPHLTLFIICLLLLLYGYEIFNFSLSIDEETFSHSYTLWASIAQGRWGIGLMSRVFPPMGGIPMLSTALFCLGLGVSACAMARLLFTRSPAQYACAGIFVSSPLWPHIAEFNVLSWGVALGCVMLVFSLILVLAPHRLGYILAVGLLAFATSIYQNLFVWFPVLLCVRYLSVVLGTAPVIAADEQEKFPWLRSGLVAVGGLLVYVGMESLLLKIFSMRLVYVQDFLRLSEFKRVPVAALLFTLHQIWEFVLGGHPLYLGYGRILTLLPLLGLIVAIGRLLWRGQLTARQRWLAGASLAAALAFALSPIVVAAGAIPARVFITWIPLSAFLAGICFSYLSLFDKPLYCILAAALFVSVWVSVSLFYTDHVARQRDEILTARIMARVDQIVPDPHGRIPFVVVAPARGRDVEAMRKVEIFGTSFFEHGPDPVRINAYLRVLGIDSLEPSTMAAVAPQRAIIESMPMWPAAGSVALVNGILVIKLGPLPPA
jgi:membrane protein implicated in regulation of membrane protease activity